MNRPFSSTLQRYSPANISGESPSWDEGPPGPVANPLLQIRTHKAPFFSEFEGGNLMVLQIAVERPRGNLQIAAGLLRGHQLALGLFGHGKNVVDVDGYT